MKLQQAIDEFLIYLKVEKNYSDNTLRAYEFDLKCFNDFLQTHNRCDEVKEFIPSTIRRFIQDQVLNHSVNPRSIQRRISCLKSFSQFCLKEKWVDIDFTVGVVSPKVSRKIPMYMNQVELSKLYRSLEKDTGTYALRNHLLFKLLATTGMRRQEIVDLTWKQVDLYSATIRVVGKGNKERILPIHSPLHPLFERYKLTLTEVQLHPIQPVFTNRNSRTTAPSFFIAPFTAYICYFAITK